VVQDIDPKFKPQQQQQQQQNPTGMHLHVFSTVKNWDNLSIKVSTIQTHAVSRNHV
jgi:hypothetical protein